MKLERSSGILLHITSLPSQFGIGDFGQEAYEFLDFLEASGYSYWQILPLNPTDGAFQHSPYSSYSAFAGNFFLISPEELKKDGYVDLGNFEFPHNTDRGKVDFEEVSKFKKELLKAAFSSFKKKNSLPEDYSIFCKEHSYWLEDYCLFMSLKEKYRDVWFNWPQDIRDRKPEALQKASGELADRVEAFRFYQYIFFRQWKKLKNQADKKNIKFIGDVPFYVNHDSVECWTHSGYFKLDENKQPFKVSGVPPDYFSETGQLWGTPVYDWDTLKSNRYEWWIERLKQNLLLFDLVRLDHFRAFSACWEVEAGQRTAVNGSWKEVPGHDFFCLVSEEFPDLPFIAEDLGTLDEGVYALLKKFPFPGMKVLQFAFGDDQANNPYLPFNHTENHLVYTGTHDNDTTVSWFIHTNDATRQHLSEYAGTDVNTQNVHILLHRMILNSVANIAVVPMQDILGLGTEGRMNVPGGSGGNWDWCLKYEELPRQRANEMKRQNQLFGRYPPDRKKDKN